MVGNFYTVTFEDVVTWPTPNYTNPPTERTWLPIYAIIWMVLTTMLVAGRLYLRIRTKPGLDDLFLIIAWAFAVAFTVIACVAVLGFDVSRHIWDVRPDRYNGGLYMGWVAQVLFIHSTGAIKTSVLIFYLRMAKDYGRRWLYTVWVLLAITIGSWIAIFIAYCFMCQPLSAYWLVHIGGVTENYVCLDGNAMTIATSVITIASDVWTAALPCIMFQFHDLGVSRRQKLALNIIFCLGFLVTGPAIARTYYLWKMGHEADISWNGYNLFVASQAECQLAIMCTCAPFLRAFFRRYFPNLTHKTRSSKSDTVTNATTVDERQNPVNFSRPRTLLKPLFGREDVIEMDFEANHEKKGLLVLDEHTGRLVWSPGPSNNNSNQLVSKF